MKKSRKVAFFGLQEDFLSLCRPFDYVFAQDKVGEVMPFSWFEEVSLSRMFGDDSDERPQCRYFQINQMERR